MNQDKQLKGLLLPPKGFVSRAPALMAAPSVKLLDWKKIKEVAESGKMDGRKLYGSRFVIQQKHNNCAGASSSRIMAKTLYDARGIVAELSDTYVYSLINGGHDQGSMHADAMEAIETRGTCLRSRCGPDAIFRTQYDTHAADAEAKSFRAIECYAIRPRDFATTDELWRGIWSALCLGFKLECAVQAGSSFDRMNTDFIVGVDNGSGNHAVHADGIALSDGDRIVGTGENTWGTWWNQEGRMLMTENHWEQTVEAHEFFAVRGVQSNPSDTRPKL